MTSLLALPTGLMQIVAFSLKDVRDIISLSNASVRIRSHLHNCFWYKICNTRRIGEYAQIFHHTKGFRRRRETLEAEGTTKEVQELDSNEERERGLTVNKPRVDYRKRVAKAVYRTCALLFLSGKVRSKRAEVRLAYESRVSSMPSRPCHCGRSAAKAWWFEWQPYRHLI